MCFFINKAEGSLAWVSISWWAVRLTAKHQNAHVDIRAAGAHRECVQADKLTASKESYYRMDDLEQSLALSDSDVLALQTAINAYTGDDGGGDVGVVAADDDAAASSSKGGKGKEGKGKGKDKSKSTVPSGYMNRLMSVTRYYNMKKYSKVEDLINREFLQFHKYREEWERFNGL